MASKVRTFYTCDICGAQGEVPNTVSLPKDWKEIQLYQKEKGTSYDRGTIHACDLCCITKENADTQPQVVVKSVWERLKQRLK